MNILIRNCRLGSALAVCLLNLTPGICLGQQSSSVQLNEKTSLSFTSVEEGRKLIGIRDDYINRLGELEIQLRLESKKPVTIPDFLKGMQASVIEWKPEEIKLLREATRTLQEKMKPYHLPFPDEVHLIRVSPAGGLTAPHCRKASIILTDKFFEQPKQAATILAHELFHVLSSHNSDLRDRLYRIINFVPANEIELPPAIRPMRLTNPDAPINQHVVHLTIDGDKATVVPVLMAKSSRFRAGGLFANLDFYLMVLEKRKDNFVPKLDNGQPELLAASEAPDFMKKIGRNTLYIIHPEETLADNFWMMLLGSDRIRDPWIINEMKEVLKK